LRHTYEATEALSLSAGAWQREC